MTAMSVMKAGSRTAATPTDAIDRLRLNGLGHGLTAHSAQRDALLPEPMHRPDCGAALAMSWDFGRIPLASPDATKRGVAVPGSGADHATPGKRSMSPEATGGAADTIVHEVLRSPGQPLDAA